MSRSTQFIGLHQVAYEFLAKNKSRVLAEYKMTTGMFDEEILGQIYEVEILPGNDPDGNHDEDYHFDDFRTYVEVVNAEIWSSGPMIYTCLMEIPSGEKKFMWPTEDYE